MEIKIQLDKDMVEENVIGTLVAEEDSDNIVGEIKSYDQNSGVAICQLYEKKTDNES